MVDNKNFKQVGTLFGVPILLDLTNTTPDKELMIIDQSQLVLRKAFTSQVQHDHEPKNPNIEPAHSRGKTVPRHCKRCGIIFYPRLADVKRGWGMFCSKSCKAEYQMYGKK